MQISKEGRREILREHVYIPNRHVNSDLSQKIRHNDLCAAEVFQISRRESQNEAGMAAAAGSCFGFVYFF